MFTFNNKWFKQLSPIKYIETLGSAQCKSAVIFAGMRTRGTTIIKAKKSRNHTELLCKYLNLPVSVKKYKNYEIIKVKKVKNKQIKLYNSIRYKLQCFFIVLTILSENSKLIIKNVNINSTRIGIVSILKMMGAKIKLKNKKIYKGEKSRY